MSAAPWTPGPWTVTEFDEATLAIGPEGEPVAYIDEADTPDAHLIAAAPEMAQLLQALHDADAVYNFQAPVSGLFRDVRALLARVRGETP